MKYLKIVNNIPLEKLIKEYDFSDAGVHYIVRHGSYELGNLNIDITLRVNKCNREIELEHFLDSESNDTVVCDSLYEENNLFLCILFDLINDGLVEKVVE